MGVVVVWIDSMKNESIHIDGKLSVIQANTINTIDRLYSIRRSCSSSMNSNYER